MNTTTVDQATVADDVRRARDEDIMRRVAALDLEPIVFKLTTPDSDEETPPLTLEEADRDVALYRGFLALAALYDEPLVPSKRVDRVWHAHILDTAKYAQDCELVFGYFMHHFPYSGMRGDEDQARWQVNADRTRQLFLEHFGVPLSDDANPCQSHGGGGMCVKCDCERAAADMERPRPDRADYAPV